MVSFTEVRNNTHSVEACKHAFIIPNKFHIIELFKKSLFLKLFKKNQRKLIPLFGRMKNLQ